jgi:hypothetical protein
MNDVVRSTGSPTPNGFNSPTLPGPNAGYRYADPRIDDETALKAASRLNPTNKVLRDAAALEIQFDRFANGQLGNDYMVPGWVAQNGLDANHKAGVKDMLGEMSRIAGLNPALTNELMATYDDAIATQKFARDSGLKPYGQRPGELGEWTR